MSAGKAQNRSEFGISFLITNNRTSCQDYELDLRLGRSHFFAPDDRTYRELTRWITIAFSNLRSLRSLISRRNDHDPCQNHELDLGLERSYFFAPDDRPLL